MRPRYLAIILLLIIFLGAFLRFYRIEELGTFRADQAIELSGARDILSGKLTLIGIKTSNSEVRNGAVMYYLLAPFVWLFKGDPVAGGVLQSLLSLGTVGVVFYIIKKYIGPKEALFGAFLTATSSLLVLYSRQTLLAFYPLFFNSVVFLISMSILKKFRTLLVLTLGIFLGITIQIHYSAIALILASWLLPLVFIKKSLWLKYYFYLFFGLLLGLLPMIFFELRHQFFNTKMLFTIKSASANVNFLGFWQDALSRFLFGGNVWLARIFLLTVGGAIIFLRKKIGPIQKLSLVFIIASIIFTLIFRNSLQPPYEYISHYAIVSFIPLVILTSWLIGRLPTLFMFLTAIAFLVFNFSSFGLFNNHGYSHGPGWGQTGIKKAASLIKADLTDRPYNVAMLVDGESQAYPLRYLLSDFPNQPLAINRYDRATDLYLIVEPGLDLSKVNLWELSSFGPYEISKTWDLQNGYTLYRLTHDRGQSDFLTLVYPVRGKDLWVNPSEKPLNDLLSILKKDKFPATFLFQYDAFTDKSIVKKIKENCFQCEFGILLEVSERLATDANVSYKVGDGSWTRPDKTFLSGYSLLDRQKLINRNFLEFKKVFDHYPTSVGGWYVDPYSLKYLHDKYQVNISISVADQQNTDAQRYWGKPWGTPYYSQRYDLLSAVSKIEDKLDIVQIQWAQRHPTDGYGNGVWFSQNSFQANDYINNHREDYFFPNLLKIYLENDNPVNQITVGLEVGQELTSFATEHFRQLVILKDQVDAKKIHPATMKDFSKWYQEVYPGVSPTAKISDGTTTWINTPCYRLGTNTVDFDLRLYKIGNISPDNFGKDESHFLSREIDPSRDYNNKECQKAKKSFPSPDTKIWMIEKLEAIDEILSHFKRSVISGKPIIGISTNQDTLYGFWLDHGFGEYTFPFQTMAKFISPSISPIIK